jgi:hypothetical protein
MPEDEKGGKWKLLEILLTSQNLILVVGAIFVALAAAGGLTYNQWLPIAEDRWRIVMGIFGLVLVVLYFLLPRKAVRRLDDRAIKALGVKITFPEDNSRITGLTDVRGTMEMPIPDGYELRILRGYPQGGLVPNASTLNDPHKKTWLVQQFDIGGSKDEGRRIEAWLVGPDGHLLIDTWLTAHEVHSVTNRRMEILAPSERLTWLKPLKEGTSDMYRCDWIKVTRA